MKARVLIVEDEVELAELIELYLRKEGIESEAVTDAESAIKRLQRTGAAGESFDLVVLDINLPGMDGFEFLTDVRPGLRIPVIIVSARAADEDIIMGLGIGADEFVTKPFAPRVLVARIRALLRRSRSEARAIACFGPFTVDLEGYVLRRGETRVSVSTKEFEVLRHLVLHSGRAMSSDEIYAEVWGNEYGDTTSVAVYVWRLRKKLEDDPRTPLYIQTIHGRGYRFNPETLKEGGAS